MIMKSTGRQLDNQPTGEPLQSGENLQEQISRRAYELYLERGGQSDASQNWLDAETVSYTHLTLPTNREV